MRSGRHYVVSDRRFRWLGMVSRRSIASDRRFRQLSSPPHVVWYAAEARYLVLLLGRRGYADRWHSCVENSKHPPLSWPGMTGSAPGLIPHLTILVHTVASNKGVMTALPTTLASNSGKSTRGINPFAQNPKKETCIQLEMLLSLQDS